MIDIIRALLGRHYCPWCRHTPAHTTTYDRIYDRLPVPVLLRLSRYNYWAGQVGGVRIHSRHEVSGSDATMAATTQQERTP